MQGLVLVDKPAGPSSFAVVQSCDRATASRRATRAHWIRLRAGSCSSCWAPRRDLPATSSGSTSATRPRFASACARRPGDGEGEVVEESAIAPLEEIEALEGEIELRVPQASAVKIEGERAYRLQRRGVAVEMPIRRSTIHELRVVRYEPPLVELDLKVSSGTYIRAIADHLGGHCRTIRRTAVGPFGVEDADEENVLAPLAALVSLPERGLSEEETLSIRQGRSIPGSEKGPVALHFAGHLVAVAQGDGRTLRPETVLPAA